MKHIKTFESYVSSLNEADSLGSLKKALPGMNFKKADYEVDPEDEYQTVESFYVNVPGISGGYGEDDLYINIYDGKDFCFFYDSAPIGTSLHNRSEINSMDQTEMEVPKPLNKLNKKIFDEVVKKVKEMMGVEESRVNEINSRDTLGPKAKKFTTMIGEWDYFTDAEGKESGKMPDEYYVPLKTLNIKADDAIVCFSGAVGSWDKILRAAKQSGINYVEVDDTETGDMAIVFTAKQ